ncbi:MAG: toprim domain-containing protein, partial [Sandaracinaceae bacterium]
FPVSDQHGTILAFSGRALAPVEAEEREAPAKYINSPESALYKKGEILFGLHEARIELRKREVALLCEGNFDVLALAQAGFANVVAPLGTAFTELQAKLLRRFATTAVLLFDSDAAGQKAARAAQPLLAKAGIAGKVVTLPAGDDPDSYLRNRGAEAMGRLIDEAPPIVEWLIETFAAQAGRDPHARAEAIETLGPVIASLENPVEARLYVERVAHAFEVSDVRAVREQLHKGARAAGAGSRRRGPEPPPTARPAGSATNASTPSLRRGPRPTPLELQVVGAFLDQPGLHASGLTEKIHEVLTGQDLRAILATTARWVGARAVNASELLAADFLAPHGEDAPIRKWLTKRLAVQEFADEASAARFVERAIPKLEHERVARRNKRLKRDYLEAKRAGDDSRADELMREMSELFKSARRPAKGA